MATSMNVEINDRAYTVALKNVQAMPETLFRIVETDVRPAVEQVVKQELVPYPPPIRKGVFKLLATPKQFRFVMAKIRRGEWTGRTGG